MVLFSQFQNRGNKMILSYHSVDEFKTIKWMINNTINSNVKTLHNTSTLIQCNMILLMEHKITYTL